MNFLTSLNESQLKAVITQVVRFLLSLVLEQARRKH
jgi:hypothetical protein